MKVQLAVKLIVFILTLLLVVFAIMLVKSGAIHHYIGSNDLDVDDEILEDLRPQTDNDDLDDLRPVVDDDTSIETEVAPPEVEPIEETVDDPVQEEQIDETISVVDITTTTTDSGATLLSCS